MTVAAQTAAPRRTRRQRPGWRKAIREAGFAALVMLGLSFPIVALRTEQNMANELVLAPRWSWCSSPASAVFIARLRPDALREQPRQVPDRLRQPDPARRAGARGRTVSFDSFAATVFTVGIVLIGAGVGWERRVETAPAKVAAPAGAPPRFAAIRPFVAPAALGFLAVYPIMACWPWSAPGGSIKWIDNFGIQILIYIMLGWGLNIVVGLAGLLDLGYVAFYAVGAYSYALLATKVIPETFPALGVWAFWICLPISGLLAALWGILLGFPVLRLRGDYLAIVTLAFGEIIRLVLINWVDFSNGYAGISSIPRPSFFGIPFNASDTGLRGRVRAGVQPDLPHDLPLLRHPVPGAADGLRHRAPAPAAGRPRLGGAARGRDRLPLARHQHHQHQAHAPSRSAPCSAASPAASSPRGRASSRPESFTFIESAQVLAIVVLGGTGSLRRRRHRLHRAGRRLRDPARTRLPEADLRRELRPHRSTACCCSASPWC